MKSMKEYIESGILELYVLGMTTDEESQEVHDMSALHEEIRTEIDAISQVLLLNAEAADKAPNPTIKSFLVAMIDFTARMQNGEVPTFPPQLNEWSRKSDFEQWLSRPDMVIGEDFEDFYTKIIGYTPEYSTAIVWIKDMAPHEVHHDQYEKFLILEGTCDITVGDNVHQLVPGNYFSIPLHENHLVKVTSDIPCKVILQRVAA